MVHAGASIILGIDFEQKTLLVESALGRQAECRGLRRPLRFGKVFNFN